MNSLNIQLLVEIIGEEATVRLADTKNFGGGFFDFPKSEVGLGAQSFASLAECVGMDRARALCKRFGGESLYIPKLTKEYLQERNKSIVKKYNGGNGMSVRELMREYGLSDRHIWKILKETNTDVETLVGQYKQESLF